jgi:plasmid stabilization system protein ParE
MIFPLIVRPEAEEDISDAFRWYESQSIGLGAEFIRSVEASFSSIGRNPELYAEIHLTIRRALVRRFPYGIFYLLDKDKINILAVMYIRRHPRRWQNRNQFDS